MAWKDLFQPASTLADNGFPISGRLAAAIEGSRTNLLADAEATATYFNADLTPKALGTTLKIPAYAATLAAIANGGADALYTGPIAQAIVAKINATTHAHDRRRDHAGQDHARRPRRLPGEEARRRLHDLPRVLGLRHGRRRRRAGSPSRRRSASSRTSTSACTRRPRSTSKAASRRCSACTWSARPSGSPTPTATSTSPTPTSWRCPAAATSAMLEQDLPAQPRRPDQLHDQHGHGAAGQPRPGAAGRQRALDRERNDAHDDRRQGRQRARR